MDKTCESCKHYFEPTTKGVCLECLHIPAPWALWEPEPMTNRDRLRTMTDEELAKFFYDTDTEIPWCDECRSHHEEPNGCEKCMVDWLKEEAG